MTAHICALGPLSVESQRMPNPTRSECEALAQWPHGEIFNSLPTLRDLARAYLELLDDKGRLDWLEHRGSVEIECSMDDEYSIGDQIDEEQYPSLREAIDAARNAAPREPRRD